MDNSYQNVDIQPTNDYGEGQQQQQEKQSDPSGNLKLINPQNVNDSVQPPLPPHQFSDPQVVHPNHPNQPLYTASYQNTPPMYNELYAPIQKPDLDYSQTVLITIIILVVVIFLPVFHIIAALCGFIVYIMIKEKTSHEKTLRYLQILLIVTVLNVIVVVVFVFGAPIILPVVVMFFPMLIMFVTSVLPILCLPCFLILLCPLILPVLIIICCVECCASKSNNNNSTDY